MATIPKLVEYLDPGGAAAALSWQAGDAGVTQFARVKNLAHVFSPFELYPLAPPAALPLERIAALAVDMDGTSTTTEPLALHALEYMVRRFTGRHDPAAWPGLDPQRDLPFVIGNSNVRHTEFLIERYGDQIDRNALCQAFFEAVAWTLANMTDPQRRGDITLAARHCGLADVLADGEFQRMSASAAVNAETVGRLVVPFVHRYGNAFGWGHEGDLVHATLSIYYMRYHAILQDVERGEGDRLSRELFGAGGRTLVAPMPGYAVLVPLVKGWLGSEVGALFEPLLAAWRAQPHADFTAGEIDQSRARLVRLAAHFQHRPAKLALVTASIAYEAHAVMQEIVRLMAREVSDWPIPAERREILAGKLADHRDVFDGFVSAGDVHEARLKPHPDLYSTALHQMSVPKPDYPCCVGIEDTEPGIVSLRAAGVGCAVALPNRDTQRQNYAAAARVVTGGLPELMLVHNLMLKDQCPPDAPA